MWMTVSESTVKQPFTNVHSSRDFHQECFIHSFQKFNDFLQIAASKVRNRYWHVPTNSQEKRIPMVYNGGMISPHGISHENYWVKWAQLNYIPGERSTAADMCRYMDQRLQVPIWNLSGWNARSFWSTWSTWKSLSWVVFACFCYLRLLKEWEVVCSEVGISSLMLWVPPQFSCFFLRHLCEIIHETFTPVWHPAVFGGIRNLYTGWGDD